MLLILQVIVLFTALLATSAHLDSFLVHIPYMLRRDSVVFCIKLFKFIEIIIDNGLVEILHVLGIKSSRFHGFNLGIAF